MYRTTSGRATSAVVSSAPRGVALSLADPKGPPSSLAAPPAASPASGSRASRAIAVGVAGLWVELVFGVMFGFFLSIFMVHLSFHRPHQPWLDWGGRGAPRVASSVPHCIEVGTRRVWRKKDHFSHRQGKTVEGRMRKLALLGLARSPRL